MAPELLSPSSKQNYLDGFKHNYRIKKQPLVFDVKEIVLQLLPGIFNRSAIRILDLRPTGKSWGTQVSLFVVWNLISKLFDEMRALRSRPNKAHLAPQNAPKLGNLVYSNFPNYFANSRRTVAAFRDPNRSVSLGINSHRPKLRKHEYSTVLPDALLPVKD